MLAVYILAGALIFGACLLAIMAISYEVYMIVLEKWDRGDR